MRPQAHTSGTTFWRGPLHHQSSRLPTSPTLHHHFILYNIHTTIRPSITDETTEEKLFLNYEILANLQYEILLVIMKNSLGKRRVNSNPTRHATSLPSSKQYHRSPPTPPQRLLLEVVQNIFLLVLDPPPQPNA